MLPIDRSMLHQRMPGRAVDRFGSKGRTRGRRLSGTQR